MKINIPRLLLLLVVLVAVFLVIKYTGNKDRSKSFRSELVNIDTASVSKVLITDKGKVTTLLKNEDKWFVEEEGRRNKAMNRTVKSMLSTLQRIEPSRLAARSSEKWKNFSVDSAGTRVEVFEGKEKTLDIVLGRLGFENQQNYYTYVRLYDEEDVYVADQFMKMSISTDGSAYRNNVLARISADSISMVTFNYPDSSFILDRINEKWIIGEAEADSASTADYLNIFSYVSSASRQFAERVAEGTTPELSVVVGTGTSEVTFSGFRGPEGWIIHSSENPEEYFSDKSLFDKIFVTKDTFINK